MKNKILLSVLILTALSFVAWFGLKFSVEAYASLKADEIAFYANKTANTSDEKVKLITARISESFQHRDPSKVAALKFRSYVTNRRLPEFMRWEEGVVETIVNKGLCDNAARQLSYVLKQNGLESKQWNMMTLKGGHTALLVSMPDGREVLTDPLFGLAAVDESGNLISPEKALRRVNAGEKIENVFKAISEKSNHKFYKAYKDVSMATQGENLEIRTEVPDYKDELVMGKIDNNSRDVKTAGNKMGLGPYWHYVGHAYDPNWVRVLKANQSTEITFILTQKPDDTVLTSEPAPKIEGNKMIWDLDAGEEIKFYDRRAKLSLKRRNSYIDVDQVIFSKN